MSLDLGFVLPMLERPSDGTAPSWTDMVAMARTAEDAGADTVWLADEVLWRVPEWEGPRGWWDGLTTAGAVAASTTTIGIGTWVMSAVQHEPGMIVRAAQSLDEITAGRFVLGLGTGHAGGATEIGFATDQKVARYLEAVEIIVPLLRSDDPVTFDGDFHRAHGLIVRPRGPRPHSIPLMMGGHAPRTMTAAARLADTWSAYATESSLPEAFASMTQALDRICEEIGRDPVSIGRSVGVIVEPGSAASAEATGFGVPIDGSIEQIVDTIGRFADIGVTRVEIMPWPQTLDTVEALAPVFEHWR